MMKWNNGTNISGKEVEKAMRNCVIVIHEMRDCFTNTLDEKIGKIEFIFVYFICQQNDMFIIISSAQG